MKRKVFVLALVALLLGLGSPFGVQASETFTMSVAIHPLEFYQQGARVFIDHVESHSGGRIEVETFEFPILGTDPEIVEMIAYGEIHVGTGLSDGGLSQQLPSIQALSLPFLIKDSVVIHELMNEPFFEMWQQKMLEESNNMIRLLAGFKGSMRHLYTTKGPIRTPADLQEHNIKMRVQVSPFHVALWEGLGTQTVTLAADERYTALETGMIDGTEGAPMSAWQAGLMEVSQYATLTGHSFGTSYILINENYFQSLPDDLQVVVAEASRKAALTDNGYIPLSSIDALDLMRDAGITITALTEEELEQWREIALPIGLEYLESQVDAEFLNQVIEAVQEVEEQLREQRDRVIGR